jgi:hypothetical protein
MEQTSQAGISVPDTSEDPFARAIQSTLDRHLPFGQVAWGVFVGVAPDDPHRLDKMLIVAARAHSFRGIQLLLERGADPNWQDEQGWTALHFAASENSRTAIRLLVASGKCDYLIQDKQGRYAFELAVEWARDYAVGRLLAKKQAQQAETLGVAAYVPR